MGEDAFRIRATLAPTKSPIDVKELALSMPLPIDILPFVHDILSTF